MRRKIEVVPFDPYWACAFESEQALLLNVIGNNVVHIEHIGSTAVTGLMAKPIIDILIEVKSFDLLETVNHKMSLLGYVPKGENGIVGRRYFQKGGNNRTHHVHAFEKGNKHIFRHLAFKEYLIANPEIAIEYGRIKLRAAKCANNINNYMALKNDFIKQHEALAVTWYNNL